MPRATPLTNLHRRRRISYRRHDHHCRSHRHRHRHGRTQQQRGVMVKPSPPPFRRARLLQLPQRVQQLKRSPPGSRPRLQTVAPLRRLHHPPTVAVAHGRAVGVERCEPPSVGASPHDGRRISQIVRRSICEGFIRYASSASRSASTVTGIDHRASFVLATDRRRPGRDPSRRPSRPRAPVEISESKTPRCINPPMPSQSHLHDSGHVGALF